MDKDYDAIVMGCGPTGAIASILLANKGFKVAVVEKSAKPYPYPRAIALNEFTMDLLKNLLGELWEKFNFTTAVEVGYVLSKEKINEPFGLMQPPEIEGKILDLDNFGFINWIYSPQLEELLREKINSNENITTFYDHSGLILWEDGKNYLKIENSTTGIQTELSCKYLLGADGGGSFVRKQIGAPLKKLGNAISFLIVDIKASRKALQPGMEFDSGGHQIIDPSGERPTTFIHCEGKNHGSHKNHFRFEFALKPDENYASIQSPESIKELVSPYLKNEQIEIERSTVYKFNSLISTKWRVKNIFTIGDATHQTSPFLGQGLNMGIRNSYNLINKIELVEKGMSKDKLLDTYQIECFPDSEYIIKQSLFMGGLLFNTRFYVNFARGLIHFFNGGRGKPIQLFPEFVPETVTVPNGFNPNKHSQKGYPMYNYTTKDGFPRSLRSYNSTRYRIFCKDSTDAVDGHVSKIPKIIRPNVTALSDGRNGEKTGDRLLVCCQRKDDLKMHDKLFSRGIIRSNVDYVVMAPCYTMLGTYSKGEENKMVSDYLSVFKLVSYQL